MSLTTYGGEWKAGNYKEINRNSTGKKLRGAEIKLLFTPNELVDSPKIGLTQSVKAMRNETTTPVRAEVTGRTVSKDEGDEGRYHDRAAGKTNPIYGSENPSGADHSLGGGESLSNMQWGKRETKDGKVEQKDAWLTDAPKRRWNDGNKLLQSFETTALSVEGPQKDTYFGSVEWGYQTDDQGKVTLLPLKVVSMGVPTSAWMLSAEKWNDAKVDVDGTPTDTQNLPLASHASMSQDQIVGMSNDELAKKIKKLSDTIKSTEEGPNRTNMTFELKFLESEAKARGDFWGTVKHFFGFLAR